MTEERDRQFGADVIAECTRITTAELTRRVGSARETAMSSFELRALISDAEMRIFPRDYWERLGL